MLHPEEKVIKTNRAKKIASGHAQFDLQTLRFSSPAPLRLKNDQLNAFFSIYDRAIEQKGFIFRQQYAEQPGAHSIRFFIQPRTPFSVFFNDALANPQQLFHVLSEVPQLFMFVLETNGQDGSSPTIPYLRCQPCSEDIKLRYFRSRDRKLVVLARYPRLCKFITANFSSADCPPSVSRHIHNQIWVF